MTTVTADPNPMRTAAVRLVEVALQKQAGLTSRLVLDVLALAFDQFAGTIDHLTLGKDATPEAQAGAESMRQAVARCARDAAAAWRESR